MGKKDVQKRATSANDLKSLPPMMEAFAQNVRRAHLQAAIWRSALSSHPPSADVTHCGWSKDEAFKTLTPVPVATLSDVALAPPHILEMIRCGCASDVPCRSVQCGCEAAHLPCTFFCSCRTITVGIHSTNKLRN